MSSEQHTDNTQRRRVSCAILSIRMENVLLTYSTFHLLPLLFLAYSSVSSVSFVPVALSSFLSLSSLFVCNFPHFCFSSRLNDRIECITLCKVFNYEADRIFFYLYPIRCQMLLSSSCFFPMPNVYMSLNL